jgi:divalent metal cation (Fe/Co/Zn/Cd) transporter
MAAARLSVLTALGLAILKLITGILTGSLAVLTSAIDSLLDILMSGINLMAIHHAEQPADERHPYGHGKFESLATIFQALVIAVSGCWIIYEAVQRMIEASPIKQTGIGIIVMSISTVASFMISRHLRRVAKETDSSALKADSLHFSMDVYTNLALLIGLSLINDHKHELFGYHNLRTRRAGSQKLIDFHLTVCKHLSVEEAHDITDYIEKKIGDEIIGTDVTIHVEPCRRHGCPGREACPTQSIRRADDDKEWWKESEDDNDMPSDDIQRATD